MRITSMDLEVARTVLFVFFGTLAFSTTLIHTQDQSGFISIDCGLAKDGNYTDATTSLYYISDAGFVETGTNMDISQSYQTDNLAKQLNNVRSFPLWIKNCYTLRLSKTEGTNYLIRAAFMYGDYDSLNNPPKFSLHLGTDVWDTVTLDNSSHILVKEMIYTPHTDYLYICLANIGLGTPFISMLELRPLTSSVYNRDSGSLELVTRFYTYTTWPGNIRYKDDIFDRIWKPLPFQNVISTALDVDSSNNMYRLPSSVMKAAITLKGASGNLSIDIPTESPTAQYYVYFYFAELQILGPTEIREFNAFLDGDPIFRKPFSPKYLVANSFFSVKPFTRSNSSTVTFSFTKTERSTLPPIVNAIEHFMVKHLSQALTNKEDVYALLDIKSTYMLSKNWQGDPCVPQSYMWDGINCSFADPNSPSIIALNLSSSGLTGNIVASFANFTSLQLLDLSNNSLTGQIPESLLARPSLRIITSGNPNLCASSSCAKKKKSFITLIVAAISAFFALVVVFGVAFVILRRKPVDYWKFSSPVAKNKGGLDRFSYSEVKAMTENFKKELGKGGFGIVYYGCLKDGTEVAVKKLKSAAAHGLMQFETEIGLLMAIRHKNLVSLVGYCEEGDNLVLIYEYMAGGDLEHILSAEETPTWKQRLQIAIDASQGLDYLHSGCTPPIVHRDVKTPNILLNGKFQVKVADFGLSKIFPDENKTHVSTRVVGTPGYMDPAYYATQQLNEKSDVYSFGVVLLELITGQPAIMKTRAVHVNLVIEVTTIFHTGDMWSIVDPRVNNSINNHNSVMRAMDVGMQCVKDDPVERPTMSQVVTDLKECLAMEMNSTVQGIPSSNTTVRMAGMDPMAR